jgi:hypothetical protein
VRHRAFVSGPIGVQRGGNVLIPGKKTAIILQQSPKGKTCHSLAMKQIFLIVRVKESS